MNGGGWNCDFWGPDDGSGKFSHAHIHPLDDLAEHVFDDEGKCWCDPTLEIIDNVLLITHNSLDGRETFEREERKAS